MHSSRFRRASPVATFALCLIGAAWASGVAAEAPLPRERPQFSEAELNLRVPPTLAPVVSEEVAEQTKKALQHVFAKRFTDALAAQRELEDPLAVNLVEFLYLREAGSQAPHPRIAAFLQANSDWPAQRQLRRIYEVALLVQKADEEAVLAAFETEPPITNPGVILFATALTAKGETDRAADMVRELWRNGNLTDGEARLIQQRFGDYLNERDIAFRMASLAYAGNREAALRLARQLDDAHVKLVEARLAVHNNASGASTALGNVPEALRSDPLYIFAQVQQKRRAGEYEAAAELILGAPRDPELLVDSDSWSSERRIVARGLVEAGDPETAYKIISGHSARGALARLESDWHAGWIALRFLDDAEGAMRHFEKLGEVATRPISSSRADYWLGRAAAAAGDQERARRHFAAAAEHPTTYYGQLALDRIARGDMAPARKPIHADAARRLVQEREPLRALRLLAQAGYDRLVPRLLMSLAEETEDSLTLVGLAELADVLGYATASVQIGKLGTYAGAPTELYAFTRQGIPHFPTIGPNAEPALVYAIARQESLFNPVAVSPAGALGLMQLMPATAQETARTYGLAYSRERLTADPAYNAALGSAHLGELIAQYGDAYALVFAAYNAGRSRVRQWLERFGDPRAGEVDPVDWVEMIPFTETRNYVQRVMEGLQVYRATLEGEGPLLIARDLRLPEAHRGDLYIASDEEDPFAVISEAGSEESEPAPGLGFAPSATFGFGGGSAPSGFGFGGGGASSFGFGGN